MPPPKYFPLRWESTGDQFWFASPIDCAAANGHYDIVRELIQIDNNLIFKLTSLARIRRLEIVWDDDDCGGDRGLNAVAKCRSRVARNLLRDCETLRGHNSLIRAGYGGWVLYTAASAGDLVFVRELLERDPLLVFGEGEYGVTDIFYAAARSRSSEVFRAVLDCCLSAVKGRREEVPLDFRWEVMNRAVHAAAKGGSLVILRELLGDGSDVLAYRDNQGSTVLHTAAGGGQIEIVKTLISQYDGIITSVDNRGNTALHVAAYRGHLPVVEALISASPPSASSTNNHGDTFLHMAVSGFRSPSFIRLDRQIDLLRKLIAGKIEHVINSQNNDGRTPLHTAIIEDIQSDIIELIISARYIDLNINDNDGNTPLDLLNERPKSTSSEILIKRLVSAGGFSSDGRDQIQIKISRNALVSHLRLHGIGSPGTSFRVPDTDIILQAGIEDNRLSSCDFTDYSNYSGEIRATSSTPSIPNSSKFKKMNSMDRANVRFKSFLRWLGKRGKSRDKSNFEEDTISFKSYSMCSNSSLQNSPIPLRQQFSKLSNLPSNKRIMSLQGNIPSPSTKKKFVAHDARQVLPKSNLGSPCSAFSESSWPTPNLGSGSVGPSSSNQSPNLEKMKRKHGSFNLRSMNNYFCMGTHGLAVEELVKSEPRCENQQSLVV
ncbi:hypothetical protein CASFOL_009633 [Castilleja foliolosa]|uniref:Ankyrin repeat protein n=1 Tax=Castilleja foliolosa TaxID=1961234 RepID=A0ABD3DQ83_9LAMI